ncbi:MAG: DUF6680 family protein [Pannonibacter sp.]
MQLDFSIVAIVFATLFGPVLAVQTQKWLERRRDNKERRLLVFRTLMATRANPLAPQHVEALNAVPVDFYGSQGKLKQINDAWKLYLEHLRAYSASGDAWNQRRSDLFVELLYLISNSLGYKFNRAQLGSDAYSPVAFGELNAEHGMIRRGLVQLLNGEKVLPLAVKELPATVDKEALEVQQTLQRLLLEWLEGERAVKVQSSAPESSST